MRKIRAILFDGSGVITDEKPHETARDLASKYGMSERIIWDSVFCRNYDLGSVGSITSRRYYQNVIAETQLPLSYDDFISVFLQGSLVRPEMLTLLGMIRPYVSVIAVFSNQTDINTDYLHPILDPLVDVSWYSNEMHMVKPDPALYERIAKNLQFPPSELLFVDDREKNLEPAKAIGWNTLLFSSVEQCNRTVRDVLAVPKRLTDTTKNICG